MSAQPCHGAEAFTCIPVEADRRFMVGVTLATLAGLERLEPASDHDPDDRPYQRVNVLKHGFFAAR